MTCFGNWVLPRCRNMLPCSHLPQPQPRELLPVVRQINRHVCLRSIEHANIVVPSALTVVKRLRNRFLVNPIIDMVSLNVNRLSINPLIPGLCLSMESCSIMPLLLRIPPAWLLTAIELDHRTVTSDIGFATANNTIARFVKLGCYKRSPESNGVGVSRTFHTCRSSLKPE